MSARTLYDKLWDSHVIREDGEGTCLLYIDRQIIHEVTSAQAFEGLRMQGRKPWRALTSLAVPDHNVPTIGRTNIVDPVSKKQLEALETNARETGVIYIDLMDQRQGIVHVVGPEQGVCLPGMTIVCGDSHTTTSGALGALAFGIGTSQVEHVLATQSITMKKSRNMLISINGVIGAGVTAKDMGLYIIGRIGTAGGTGHTIEFGGEAVQNLSVEGRMTLCNLAIEAGARAALIAVDEKTINYVKGRPFAPRGELWERAVAHWKHLHSDEGAVFDTVVEVKAPDIKPSVTWGTSPEMVVTVEDRIPDPAAVNDPVKREGMINALVYMGLQAGTPIQDIYVDKVFIGSCTNSRIEDLRAAAEVVKGNKVADNIKLAIVVPGSGLVKKQAEDEGLDRIFTDAGMEWREPGCSMCLAMNGDRLDPGERCASTSNRNFEGRQGAGGRTHLVSPAMAAATAIAGHFTDVRKV